MEERIMHIDGPWFKDESGRTLILRGVNLGGSTKVPYQPDGASHLNETYFNHRDLTFVGRPFPLEEADEHFARLKSWGMTFLRFLITWEAVEHAGPGIYDQEYLDYVVKIFEKANEFGIQVFIDPHQDVWSRFTGGDGAPGWTLEAVGMDISKIVETGAALVHSIHGQPFPRMTWSTNYDKFAAATMFTLFFGGNDFAPGLKISGVPVQEYLQGHYINAMKQVAKRIKGLPNVVGYDTLNEPHQGWIGRKNLTELDPWVLNWEFPTPLQAMALADGIPQQVNIWHQGIPRTKVIGTRLVNPLGVRIWRDEVEDIWRAQGVWEPDSDGQPKLIKPDHFSVVNGQPVNFVQDYMRPFINRFASEIRSVNPDAIIFMEVPFNMDPPVWGKEDATNICNAAHWYDGVSLFMKNFNRWVNADLATRKLVLGPWAIRKMFARQIRLIKESSKEKLGGVPTLLGEFGISFDLENKKAYRTGNFSKQIQALDTTYSAVEANLISSTLWNYTADNTNEWGDLWNEEDLSIFSRDQQKDPSDINSGGRALEAAVRPYAAKTTGEPLHMSFSAGSKIFEYEFRHDPRVDAPTEFYLPKFQYPHGCIVEVSDGEFEIHSDEQLLVYRHTDRQAVHRLRIRKK